LISPYKIHFSLIKKLQQNTSNFSENLLKLNKSKTLLS